MTIVCVEQEKSLIISRKVKDPSSTKSEVRLKHKKPELSLLFHPIPSKFWPSSFKLIKFSRGYRKYRFQLLWKFISFMLHTFIFIKRATLWIFSSSNLLLSMWFHTHLQTKSFIRLFHYSSRPNHLLCYIKKFYYRLLKCSWLQIY